MLLIASLILPFGCAIREGTSEEGTRREDVAQTDAAENGGRPNVFVSPEQADRFWIFPESEDELGTGGEFHIYLDAETHPKARASFAKFGLGVGGALPAHKHKMTEEISYFLAGQGKVQIFEDGEVREVDVKPGDVWYVPPGAWHGVRNTGEEPLELVFATIPNEKDGLLSLFREIGVAPGEEPPPLGPAEFAKVAAEHDLILRPADESEQ